MYLKFKCICNWTNWATLNNTHKHSTLLFANRNDIKKLKFKNPLPNTPPPPLSLQCKIYNQYILFFILPLCRLFFSKWVFTEFWRLDKVWMRSGLCIRVRTRIQGSITSIFRLFLEEKLSYESLWSSLAQSIFFHMIVERLFLLKTLYYLKLYWLT